MRYAISDIHGEYSLFLELMNKINFSAVDEIYVCGDILEKGDDSVKLAMWLFLHPNVHCIRGNHEEMFLKYYNSLMKETEDYEAVLAKLQAYLGGDGYLLDWDTVEKIEALPYYIETDDFICVHAGVPLDKNNGIPPLETVMPEEFLYNRKFKRPDVLPASRKCVFYGHTSSMDVYSDSRIITYLRGEDPKSKDFKDYIKVHLDAGTSTGGWLGCFCIDTCETYFVRKRKLIRGKRVDSEREM